MLVPDDAQLSSITSKPEQNNIHKYGGSKENATNERKLNNEKKKLNIGKDKSASTQN